MRISLQTKLVLAVSALAVAAVTAVALSARQTARLEFRRFQDLESHASAGGPLVSAGMMAGVLDGVCCEDLSVVNPMLEPDKVLLIADAAGTVVAVGGRLAAEVGHASIRTSGDETTIGFERTRGGRVEGVSLKLMGVRPVVIRMADGRPASVHVVTLPSGDDSLPAVAFQGAIDRRLLFATIVISAIAIGLTWVVARRTVRPIDELGRAAAALAAGDLSRRVTVRGSDEIATLAARFNAMAEEMARQQDVRRGLLHDVTHELRTPLTALQCRLETGLDGLAPDPRQSLAQAHEDVRHLARLVEDLEMVALAEGRDLPLDISSVVVADVAASAAGAITRDGAVKLDITPGLTVRADPVRLRQVLLNLLTNASRHTPPGGTITIRGRRQSDAETLVEVHNTGSAIAPADLERIFDRFYRVDPARQRATGGTGLGLAIVKHLIEAQSGRVSARSSDDGVAVGFVLPA